MWKAFLVKSSDQAVCCSVLKLVACDIVFDSDISDRALAWVPHSYDWVALAVIAPDTAWIRLNLHSSKSKVVLHLFDSKLSWDILQVNFMIVDSCWVSCKCLALNIWCNVNSIIWICIVVGVAENSAPLSGVVVALAMLHLVSNALLDSRHCLFPLEDLNYSLKDWSVLSHDSELWIRWGSIDLDISPEESFLHLWVIC